MTRAGPVTGESSVVFHQTNEGVGTAPPIPLTWRASVSLEKTVAPSLGVSIRSKVGDQANPALGAKPSPSRQPGESLRSTDDRRTR